jgi:hypothetical protein
MCAHEARARMRCRFRSMTAALSRSAQARGVALSVRGQAIVIDLGRRLTQR